MHDCTRKLWEKRNQHPGDRRRLFAAVSQAVDVASALYPGSWVDIAASFVFPSVTNVDIDGRAERFFPGLVLLDLAPARVPYGGVPLVV